MIFSYADTRDNEQLRLLTPAIDAFIARLKTPPSKTSTCPRQTVFFFAGGMASQLLRATQGFQEGLSVPQTFSYEVVWLTLDTLTWGTARDLRMRRDSSGVFRDRGDRIIVAKGVVFDPLYDTFIDWCANNNLDLFVFDWDWRRRLDETVTFFVRKFLPFFKARVLAAGLPDPLANFSLIGHSFGGMIVNLVLRGNDPIVANLARVITAATPFYGYPGQLHRWFEGDKYFNGLFGLFKQDIMEVVTSLPALYTLHHLDETTWGNSAAQLALDPEFPLLSYPSMDATIATLRADPYNPQINGSLVRYPGTTGFDLAELGYAKLQFQQLAAPMAANLLQKFYNLRGVRTESDGQTPVSDTAGSLTWDWIATNFNAADPSPIVDQPPVPGDDTQPAWSARLVTNAPARCITVRASDLSHMFFMNHSETLNAHASILCAPGVAMNVPVTPQPEPASDEDVIAFMRFLREHPPQKPRMRLDDPALFEMSPLELKDKLPAILRRIMMDVMKRPGPAGLSEPEGGAPATRPKGPKRTPPKTPAPKPAAPQPAARRRRRRSG
jgi:hypothetical protein